MTGGFPINVLNRIKDVPEVCRIFCATANPVQVVVAETEQGRGVLGVIDGESPKGVEGHRGRREAPRVPADDRLQALTGPAGAGLAIRLSARPECAAFACAVLRPSPGSRSLTLVVTLAPSGVASAQFLANLVKNAGVGVNVGVVKPRTTTSTSGPPSASASTFAPSAGWGWTGSLGWFTGDLVLADGSGERDVGRFRSPLARRDWLYLDERQAVDAPCR